MKAKLFFSLSKYTVQVKSISLSGGPGSCHFRHDSQAIRSNMGFEHRIFKFLGFFLLFTHWMLPIFLEIFFWFQHICSFPMFFSYREKKKKQQLENMFLFIPSVLLFCPIGSVRQFLILLGDVLRHYVLFVTQYISYAVYRPFLQNFS